MRFALLLVLPVYLLALESESMLFQAEMLAKNYTPTVAKTAPPSPTPQTDALLTTAPNWLTIDLSRLNTLDKSAFALLHQDALWELLAEIGFNAIELCHLKGAKDGLLHLALAPQWGTEAEYANVAERAAKRDLLLIGSSLGSATGKGADFALALKNVGSYPGLYSLIEVDPADWTALPTVTPGAFSINVPWLTLQTLHKMGYVPKDFAPYVKESDWNVTEPIRGVDNKMRRWLYLRNAKGFPKLDWLNPSFASERLAAGDLLKGRYQLGQKIFLLDAELPTNAKETLSLTLRKLESFSASFVQGGVAAFANPCSDLCYDHLTPMAAFHALIAQDAEALRLMYRLMLEEGVQPKTLIHPLEPFGRAPCDWAEFLQSPQKKYQYFEEVLTGEALRQRLLQEDKYTAEGKLRESAASWKEACSQLVITQDTQKKYESILELHILLAQFFAWQPGAFLLSAEDLLGTTSPFDLMRPNCEALYAPLPAQLSNKRSFASQLKAILRARRDIHLEEAELIDVPSAKSRGLLILRYRLPHTRYAALLAVNFGKTTALETLESSSYARTSAINLYTQLAEPKFSDSSLFELKLDPLSAKLILFQPTHH